MPDLFFNYWTTGDEYTTSTRNEYIISTGFWSDEYSTITEEQWEVFEKLWKDQKALEKCIVNKARKKAGVR